TSLSRIPCTATSMMGCSCSAAGSRTATRAKAPWKTTDPIDVRGRDGVRRLFPSAERAQRVCDRLVADRASLPTARAKDLRRVRGAIGNEVQRLTVRAQPRIDLCRVRVDAVDGHGFTEDVIDAAASRKG